MSSTHSFFAFRLAIIHNKTTHCVNFRCGYNETKWDAKTPQGSL